MQASSTMSRQLTSAETTTSIPLLLDQVLQAAPGFTEKDVITLIVSLKVSSVFSIVGSSYILIDILRDSSKRNGERSIYFGLMIGVAISDLLFAISVFLGTWVMPEGMHLFAIGNKVTCVTVGFLLGVAIVLSPMYIGSLSSYYLLALKCQWSRQRMKDVEKWLHIIPWILSSLPMIILLVLSTDNFGPISNEFICGPRKNIVRYSCIAMVVISIIYVVVTMSSVYRHIRRIESKAQRYSITSFISHNGNNNIISRSPSSSSSEYKRSRRVMIQGLMHALAMAFAFVVPPFVYILSRIILKGKITFFPTLVMTIFVPLQGLYHAIIYSEIVQRWFYKNNDCNHDHHAEEEEEETYSSPYCCSRCFCCASSWSSYSLSRRIQTRNNGDGRQNLFLSCLGIFFHHARPATSTRGGPSCRKTTNLENDDELQGTDEDDINKILVCNHTFDGSGTRGNYSESPPVPEEQEDDHDHAKPSSPSTSSFDFYNQVLTYYNHDGNGRLTNYLVGKSKEEDNQSFFSPPSSSCCSDGEERKDKYYFEEDDHHQEHSRIAKRIVAFNDDQNGINDKELMLGVDKDEQEDDIDEEEMMVIPNQFPIATVEFPSSPSWS